MEVVLKAEEARASRDWRVVWSNSKGAGVVPQRNKETLPRRANPETARKSVCKDHRNSETWQGMASLSLQHS